MRLISPISKKSKFKTDTKILDLFNQFFIVNLLSFVSIHIDRLRGEKEKSNYGSLPFRRIDRNIDIIFLCNFVPVRALSSLLSFLGCPRARRFRTFSSNFYIFEIVEKKDSKKYLCFPLFYFI